MKISLDSKIFMTQNLGLKIFFGNKQLLGPNNICNQIFRDLLFFRFTNFWTFNFSCFTIIRYLIFRDPNIFCNHKSFRSQNFSGPQILLLELVGVGVSFFSNVTTRTQTNLTLKKGSIRGE